MILPSTQYDYTLRPDNIRNIDVTANNNLMPYIACSVEDINGRSSGRGPLYRSYRASNQMVTFTAQDKYESYYFVNWTDENGKVVSDKTELTINRQKDQYYVANYERHAPVLNTPDTIWVGNTKGMHKVNVKNIGFSDVEMDWYVSDSHSTWIHVNGNKEGVDDGSFTFDYDANETGKDRFDNLEIFVPEIDIVPQRICIAQSDKFVIGDLNKDGKITIDEITYLIAVYLGEINDVNVDVDGDGYITVSDITQLISIYLETNK